MSALSIDNILAKLQEQQDAANAATQQRLNEALGIYDQIISQYSPEGDFGAGVEQQIERGATKAVAQGTQSLVSSGLFGTTQTAGLRKKYEEEVAQPARLQLEDLRMDRLAKAQQGKAGVLERVEDVGPDMNTISSLMQQVGAGQATKSYNVNTPSKSLWQQTKEENAAREAQNSLYNAQNPKTSMTSIGRGLYESSPKWQRMVAEGKARVI